MCIRDSLKEGVIDPYKVLYSAVESSVSTAGVIALSEVALVDVNEA